MTSEMCALNTESGNGPLQPVVTARHPEQGQVALVASAGTLNMVSHIAVDHPGSTLVGLYRGGVMTTLLDDEDKVDVSETSLIRIREAFLDGQDLTLGPFGTPTKPNERPEFIKNARGFWLPTSLFVEAGLWLLDVV